MDSSRCWTGLRSGQHLELVVVFLKPFMNQQLFEILQTGNTSQDHHHHLKTLIILTLTHFSPWKHKQQIQIHINNRIFSHGCNRCYFNRCSRSNSRVSRKCKRNNSCISKQCYDIRVVGEGAEGSGGWLRDPSLSRGSSKARLHLTTGL